MGVGEGGGEGNCILGILCCASLPDLGLWGAVLCVVCVSFHAASPWACCANRCTRRRAQGGGKIVNIASGRFWTGGPNRLDYSASKAGVIGLTRSLASEVGVDGVCVNAVTPGFTLSDTQIASSGGYAQANEPPKRAIARHQYPDDLVGAVMFLLSRGSDFMTGQTLNVDGGQAFH